MWNFLNIDNIVQDDILDFQIEYLQYFLKLHLRKAVEEFIKAFENQLALNLLIVIII